MLNVEANVEVDFTALEAVEALRDVLTAALTWLTVMIGMLAVFNMLPGAPLDGGRVLRAALWRHYGDRRRAEVAAARAGQFVAAGIIGLGAAERLLWRLLGGLWLMLIGGFLHQRGRRGAAVHHGLVRA